MILIPKHTLPLFVDQVEDRLRLRRMEQKLDRLIGESDAIWYHYTLLLFVDQVEDRLSRIEYMQQKMDEKLDRLIGESDTIWYQLSV